MNIRMIAAASLNGVIGYNNDLHGTPVPWDKDYKEDMAFFRNMTLNNTVIMGSKTFSSMGKPLPKRRNIVLSRRKVPKITIPEIEVFHSFENALETCSGDVWIIGGSYIYQLGLSVATEIYVTTIPEIITDPKQTLVYFPYINPDAFSVKERIKLSEEKNLYCNVYGRIAIEKTDSCGSSSRSECRLAG